MTERILEGVMLSTSVVDTDTRKPANPQYLHGPEAETFKRLGAGVSNVARDGVIKSVWLPKCTHGPESENSAYWSWRLVSDPRGPRNCCKYTAALDSLPSRRQDTHRVYEPTV